MTLKIVVGKPSGDPVKPTSSITLTKVFCGFFGDSTPNRLLERAKGWKVLAISEVYIEDGMTVEKLSASLPRSR